MHHIVDLIAREFSEEELATEGTAVATLLEKQKLFTEKPIGEIFGAAHARWTESPTHSRNVLTQTRRLFFRH